MPLAIYKNLDKKEKQKMLSRYACAAILVFSLVGCASVPMGDPKKDAESKSFSAKPGTAGVYIYRNESFGAAIRMDVLVDGKPLGKTAAKTYYFADVAPGRHTITSVSENSDTLALEAEAGNLYYVWQEVKMGVLYARTKLHLVNEAEGKKGVLESNLAASQ